MDFETSKKKIVRFFTNKTQTCSTQSTKKIPCPNCTVLAKKVLSKTLEHLLINKAKESLNYFDGFSYCKNPKCEIVYFRNNEILKQDSLSIVVGLKEGSYPATICYCFDWSKEKIKLELEQKGTTIAIDDIKIKMKELGCSCEILNPSGRCCLKDISSTIKELKL